MNKHFALAALLASVAMPAAAQTMMQPAPAPVVGGTVVAQSSGPVVGGTVLAPGPVVGQPMMAQGAPVRMDRETFRMMAMMSDSFEIASSRLALERSRNPRVLAYARNMIADHSMTSQALNGGTAVYAADGNLVTGSVAGAAAGAGIGFLAGGPVGAAVGAGVGATTGSVAGATGAGAIRTAIPLDARKSEMLNQLAAAEGRQFDRLYGRMQLESHQEALGLFTSYSQSGDDPQMVAFAQSVLPHLRDHVAGARRLPR
jgi:predicted outer membrane protein